MFVLKRPFPSCPENQSKQDKKRQDDRNHPASYDALRIVCNLVAFVCAAAFAYTVSQFHLATLRAFYHAWHFKFEVSPTLVFTSF